jgi:hypothetical protein
MFDRFDSALIHVVLIAFREVATAEDRDWALSAYKELGKKCGGPAAGILYWQVAENLDKRKGWHLVELAVFRDADALLRFRDHPDHLATGERLRKIADWVVGDIKTGSIG